MTGKNNAFRCIFEAAGKTESETPSRLEASSEPLSEPEPEPESKQRGRPRGKKSDPEFVSAIAYIKKKTHLQVKRLLLDKEELGDKQDFSELVQDLLDFWVEIQQCENSDTLIARFDMRSPKRKIQYCLCITIDIPLQVKVRLVANKTQRGFFNFHLTPHTQMQFISGSDSYRVGQKSINKALLGL